MVADSLPRRDEVILRGYRRGDLDAMFALDVVCFDPRFQFSRRAMRQFAEAEKARVVVAERAGEVVGFAIAHVERSAGGAVGYAVTLDVSPDARRRGLASELMAALEGEAAQAGCVEMVLHVSVANEAAMRFYERVGYWRDKVDRGFYGAGLDAWIYRKALVKDGAARV